MQLTPDGQEMGKSVTRPATQVPFAEAQCYAALVRILDICEEYQNRDIEGQDPDDIMREDDETINQICKTAADILRHPPNAPGERLPGQPKP